MMLAGLAEDGSQASRTDRHVPPPGGGPLLAGSRP